MKREHKRECEREGERLRTFLIERKKETINDLTVWRIVLLGVLHGPADEGLDMVHHLEHGAHPARVLLPVLIRPSAVLVGGRGVSLADIRF